MNLPDFLAVILTTFLTLPFAFLESCQSRQGGGADSNLTVGNGFDQGADGNKGSVLNYIVVRDPGMSQVEVACTGAFVSRHHILTAAHCVMNSHGQASKPNLIRVTSQFVSVNSVRVHPDYLAMGGKWSVKSAAVDLAIIDATPSADFEVEREARAFDEAVPPLCIRAPVVGSIIQIIGYGKISTKDHSSIETPRVGTNDVYAVNETITLRSAAASSVSGDAKTRAEAMDAVSLVGDSGGPLMFEGRVCGIGSGGGGAGVFTSDSVSIYVNLMNPRVEAFIRPIRTESVVPQ